MERRRVAKADSRDGTDEVAEAGAEDDERATGWSADELLRQKDFSELTPEELAKLRRLIAELARARPLRRSRRLRRHPRGDDARLAPPRPRSRSQPAATRSSARSARGSRPTGS